jgi:hypothetical protein
MREHALGSGAPGSFVPPVAGTVRELGPGILWRASDVSRGHVPAVIVRVVQARTTSLQILMPSNKGHGRRGPGRRAPQRACSVLGHGEATALARYPGPSRHAHPRTRDASGSGRALPGPGLPPAPSGGARPGLVRAGGRLRPRHRTRRHRKLLIMDSWYLVTTVNCATFPPTLPHRQERY